MKTNKGRIEKDILALGAISCVEGIGCTRYTYTDEFAKARDYIMKEMKDAGLSVVENEIGMVVGKLEGKNPKLPAVMTGSHFDTVATGGKFDGAAGVVAALETARVFKEEGFVPERPVLFVALPEEEGSRFGSGLFGSRAICGQLYDDELNRFKDRNGISFAEAMKAYGLDPSKVDNVKMNKEDLKAFIELHIEQGPILENEGIDVGIVDSIVGLRVMNVHVYGRSDHAGTTPIKMRADAMLAAAKAMTAATEKALEIGEGTVVTFGQVETVPAVFNIVAKEAFFTVDCRSKTLENVDAVLDTIRKSLEQSAKENSGLSYEMSERLSANPTEMKPEIQKIMEDAAKEEGITTRKLLSGAGHDAMIMGSMFDVAMVFAKSHEGRSHVPEEWTDFEDLQNAIEVVYKTVKKLAEE